MIIPQKFFLFGGKKVAYTIKEIINNSSNQIHKINIYLINSNDTVLNGITNIHVMEYEITKTPTGYYYIECKITCSMKYISQLAKVAAFINNAINSKFNSFDRNITNEFKKFIDSLNLLSFKQLELTHPEI